MLKLTVLLLSTLFTLTLWADETCSRVAVINYQKVLVDVSRNNRGEGLRYYLEKDRVSKELLDEYQDNNRSSWKSAAVTTTGTVMLLAGLLRTSEGANETFTSRKFLMFGGAAFIAVGYFLSKATEYNNEYLLSQSVEEYNKRNTPKIFFSPTDPKNGIGLGVGVGQEF